MRSETLKLQCLSNGVSDCVLQTLEPTLVPGCRTTGNICLPSCDWTISVTNDDRDKSKLWNQVRDSKL